MKQIDGHILTPLGLIHQDQIHLVMKASGLNFDKETENWSIFSQSVKAIKGLDKKGSQARIDKNIPVRFYNFQVALIESKIRFSEEKNTIDVIKHALLLRYEDHYLPKIKGVSSYSVLLKQLEQKEKNYFANFKRNSQTEGL